ncbi:hypothetical protein TNIN_465481 [Trichonephila inaurata madagascariensis]|uniref:Uncharacterized protein n=1 Tax=Trichonephila inaurata madagascariensis TaxID=2747483 RepID=A0A8X6XF40_9ARAC|nr:hypothetical protein TNIN_465481 [Trichonephila inaurata madagascariensis]
MTPGDGRAIKSCASVASHTNIRNASSPGKNFITAADDRGESIDVHNNIRHISIRGKKSLQRTSDQISANCPSTPSFDTGGMFVYRHERYGGEINSCDVYLIYKG